MLYPRQLEDLIKLYFDDSKAVFILGARQVGKTSLLKRIRANFPSNRTFYFDLENYTTLNIFRAGIENFLKHLDNTGANLQKRNYIFLDEIQYLDDFSNFIKLAVDHYSRQLKLFISGSSATQIKMKFSDSLAGRKIVFHLQPLSFKEYLVFNNEEVLNKKIPEDIFTIQDDPLSTESEKLFNYFREFVIYGGFPGIVLQKNYKKKQLDLLDIINSYIIKDIRNLFKIEKLENFNHIVQYLAFISGNLLNINSLIGEVKLNRKTVDNYLEILKNTFIIHILPAFYNNKLKELKKMPKVYFEDTGIRNALVKNFNELNIRNDRGQLLENAVFSSLNKRKSVIQNLYFWRTQDKKEVDFVFEEADRILPIEVKYSKVRATHLKYFMNFYNLRPGYVTGFFDYWNDGNIKFIPIYLI